MKDIVLDFNRITKEQVSAWREGREKLEGLKKEQYDFEAFFQLVIVSWPYGEVDYKTYCSLGYQDSLEVDRFVSEAFESLHVKKTSEQQST